MESESTLSSMEMNLDSALSPSWLALFRDNCLREAERLSRPFEPVILLSCGCFSPITYPHLRMFGKPRLAGEDFDAYLPELARDYFRDCSERRVIGGLLSPVHDAYEKIGLASGADRLEMCRLAVLGNEFVAVDDWEVRQSGYTRTLQVLRHYHHILQQDPMLGSAQIVLLAGSDLLQTLPVPSIWDQMDVDAILKEFGMAVVERGPAPAMSETIRSFIQQKDILHRHQDSISIIAQPMPCSVSSTALRALIAQHRSIRYLTPDSVIAYIHSHSLYKPPL